MNVRPLDWLVSGTRFANRVFATMFGVAAALGSTTVVLVVVAIAAAVRPARHAARIDPAAALRAE